MAVGTRLITIEELEKMPQTDARVELVEGEIIKMPPAGHEHGEIAGNIFAAMHAFIQAGTRLLWIIRPRTRTVTVYRSREDIRLLTAEETLDGADVLPGFSLPVREIF
jgi:Uma2 family endonuclease